MTQTEFDPTLTAVDGTGATPGCSCPGGCGSARRAVSRRAAIGAGVVAGAALVTACGSSDTATTSSSTGSSATSAGTTASSSTTATSSTAPTSGTAGSVADTAPSAAPAPNAAPAGPRLAAVADIPSGGSLIVANGDQQIALARNADGTVVGHTAICTHQGCTVEADGASLRCPCHGSVFDAFTGAVVRAPANAPLAEISVEVGADAVHLIV